MLYVIRIGDYKISIFFFKNLQNIQHSIQKIDIYVLVFVNIILLQKHAIYILLI